jgi:hypothetical protein
MNTYVDDVFSSALGLLRMRFVVPLLSVERPFTIANIVTMCLMATIVQSLAQQSTFTYDASGNTISVVSSGGSSPGIEAQPQPGLFQTNGLVSFSVTATGVGLSYQWLSNGVAIAGATSDTLLMSNLPATSSGSFSVVISNNSGLFVTSTPVALWLDSRGVGMPDWWQMQYFGNLNQPPDGDYDGDGVNNRDEYLEGTNPTNAASYDPRLKITDFGGGSVAVSPEQPYYTMGQSVTLTPIPDSGMGFLAWGGGITGLGSPATLMMNRNQSVQAFFGAPWPSVLVAPTTQIVPAGSSVSFSLGESPYNYQWQFDGTNLPNITTVAGNGTAAYSGDGGEATNAELSYPVGLAVDVSGDLFIADQVNHRIRKVGTNGIITTVAGNGTGGYFGDGGAAASAELYYPGGVAVDASGNLFIADSYNSRIRKVGTNGIITTVAGTGANGYSGDGGAATNAELYYPYGVAVDAFGNLFIADSSNEAIRKVGTNGIITTVAGIRGSSGVGLLAYAGDGGPATNALLYYPRGVAVDVFGDVFIADTYNQRIRKVGTNGIISTVAGNGTNGYFGDGAAATNAELHTPYGLAVDALGNLFIADSTNNRIREVGTNGFITTVAGNAAELNLPYGVVVDASVNLFIADTHNQRIGKAVLQGSTLVLNNVDSANAGSYDVVVSNPYGTLTSSVVTLTVVSQTAPQIASQPTNQSVVLGGSASFSVSATGTPPLAYQWQFGGTNLVLATNASLPLNAIAATNAGNYDVIITNASGSITSAIVTLSVLGVPVSFVTTSGGIQFSNGQLHLTLSGLTGQGAVVIETSSNLTLWTPIFTNPSGFGTIQFVDPTAANSRHRYYRATTPSP